MNASKVSRAYYEMVEMIAKGADYPDAFDRAGAKLTSAERERLQEEYDGEQAKL